ncbi:MAG: ABC transporter ATP-binding protein [Rhodoferax sp.]|nr:ABC transporter ATP-binding protein [Rhodoferax sp.]
MANDIAISVKNLTKTYRLFGHPGDRIKQFFSLGLKEYHKEFTALKDVSFEIKRGETVGIIGRNGSGKSTLLQLICGILKPTSGSVQVNGRISALLELGAGFNPEFTGRENVYFQGTLMGFTQAQMDERFDDIAAFADIGEFIEQPVRTYSSGMFVRLAFATAVNVDPDILVIDEALAVGDQRFQVKCLERIDAIRRGGGTVVLVSHVLEQVAHHCQTAYLLENGILRAGGIAATTLNAYVHRQETTDSVTTHIKQTPWAPTTLVADRLAAHPGYTGAETRWGDGKAQIFDACIVEGGHMNPQKITAGKLIEITYDIFFTAPVRRPIFGLTIKSNRGALLYSTNSRDLVGETNDRDIGDRVCVTFRITPYLDNGRHLLSFGVVSTSTNGLEPHDRRYDVIALEIDAPRTSSGVLDMQPEFDLTTLP